MNAKKNVTSLNAGTLTGMVVVVTLLHLCWIRVRSDTFSIKPVVAEVTKKTPDVPPEFAGLINHSGQANLFLKLKAVSNTNDLAEYLAGYFYFRANYLLYPRRLYIAPESQVINRTRQWLQLDFKPDPDWLRQHQVTAIWTCDLDRSLVDPFEKPEDAK